LVVDQFTKKKKKKRVKEGGEAGQGKKVLPA